MYTPRMFSRMELPALLRFIVANAEARDDVSTYLEFDLCVEQSFDVSLALEILAWADARRRELPEAYPRFVELSSMDEWADEISNPSSAGTADGRWLTTIAYAPAQRLYESCGFQRIGTARTYLKRLRAEAA